VSTAQPTDSPAARTAPAAQDWISALVRRHRIRLLVLATRRGVPADLAFDCVQDALVTFLAMPEARALAARDEECARLLSTLVGNAARTLRRRVRAARARARDDVPVDALAGAGVTADEWLAGAETAASLQRCMLELSELQRAVVTLRMLDELPGEEVAAALGISAQNVAVVLHRARGALRGCLSAACGQCGECGGGVNKRR
jgi:RNA polymerase sigma-70 factor (ECF subfamily)